MYTMQLYMQCEVEPMRQSLAQSANQLNAEWISLSEWLQQPVVNKVSTCTVTKAFTQTEN